MAAFLDLKNKDDENKNKCTGINHMARLKAAHNYALMLKL
jgi:hypothetical protein